MSKVQVREPMFVGFNGQSVWLEQGAEYDENDPMVKAMPDRFTAPEPKRVMGRQTGARGKDG